MILLLDLLLRALVLELVLLKPLRDSDTIVLDAAPITRQVLLLADGDRRLIARVAALQVPPQNLLFMGKRVARTIHSCLRRKTHHIEVLRNPQTGASPKARRVRSIGALRQCQLLGLLHTLMSLHKGSTPETPKRQSLLRMHKPSFYQVLVFLWLS